jgi:acetyl esterase/lipase
MLRDIAHAYAKKLADDGNDITYVHYPELPHGFIQMTARVHPDDGAFGPLSAGHAGTRGLAR